MSDRKITSIGILTVFGFSSSVFAAAAPAVVSAPTLGEWGLAGIAALLAIAGGRALRKRRP